MSEAGPTVGLDCLYSLSNQTTYSSQCPCTWHWNRMECLMVFIYASYFWNLDQKVFFQSIFFNDTQIGRQPPIWVNGTVHFLTLHICFDQSCYWRRGLIGDYKLFKGKLRKTVWTAPCRPATVEKYPDQTTF